MKGNDNAIPADMFYFEAADDTVRVLSACKFVIKLLSCVKSLLRNITNRCIFKCTWEVFHLYLRISVNLPFEKTTETISFILCCNVVQN